MSRRILRASFFLLFMFTSISAANAQSDLEYSETFTLTLTVTHPPTTCGINTTNTPLDYGTRAIPASTSEQDGEVRIVPQGGPLPPTIHFFGGNVYEYTATFGALPSMFPNLTMETQI